MFNEILNGGGRVMGKAEWTPFVFYILPVSGNCLLVVTTEQCLYTTNTDRTNTDQRLLSIDCSRCCYLVLKRGITLSYYMSTVSWALWQALFNTFSLFSRQPVIAMIVSQVKMLRLRKLSKGALGNTLLWSWSCSLNPDLTLTPMPFPSVYTLLYKSEVIIYNFVLLRWSLPSLNTLILAIPRLIVEQSLFIKANKGLSWTSSVGHKAFGVFRPAPSFQGPPLCLNSHSAFFGLTASQRFLARM